LYRGGEGRRGVEGGRDLSFVIFNLLIVFGFYLLPFGVFVIAVCLC